MEEIWYFPSENDKVIITGLCNQIIDLLDPLNIQQKAFALAQLVSSFEDISGIRFESILTRYNEGKQEKDI